MLKTRLCSVVTVVAPALLLACGAEEISPPIGRFVLDQELTTEFSETRLVRQGGLQRTEAAARAPRIVGDLSGEITLAEDGTGELHLVDDRHGDVHVTGPWTLDARRVTLTSSSDPEMGRELMWVDGSRALHLVMELDSEEVEVVFLGGPE